MQTKESTNKKMVNMQCEICGQEIRGRSQRVRIEGTTLEVCPKCAQHGKTISIQRTPPATQKTAPAATGRTVLAKRPRRDIFDALKEELITDLNALIKQARENAGLTIDELADKINEKASLIRKIERGDIHPEDSVRKKLEHTLHIRLTEQITSGEYKRAGGNKETTLGDIATIKQK